MTVFCGISPVGIGAGLALKEASVCLLQYVIKSDQYNSHFLGEWRGDPARVPGDIGFDPLGYGKKMSEEEMDTMKLKELNNGRLAMLAIGGMIHHNWVTGEPLF